jgi:hypothetical protein
MRSRGLDLDYDEDDRPQPKQLHGLSLVELVIPGRVPNRVSLTTMPGPERLTEFIRRRVGTRNQQVPALGMLRGRRVDQRELLKHGCLGGLETIGIGSIPARDDPSDFDWKVKIKQLLVVPSDLAEKIVSVSLGMTPVPSRKDTSWRISMDPTRRDVVVSVARILRYDKLLMYGDPEQAIVALQCRGGSRLTNTFGILYGRTKS